MLGRQPGCTDSLCFRLRVSADVCLLVPMLSLSQLNWTLLVLVVDVPAAVRLVLPLATPTPECSLPRSEEVGRCAPWFEAGWRFGISFGMAPAVLSLLGTCTLIASGCLGKMVNQRQAVCQRCLVWLHALMYRVHWWQPVQWARSVEEMVVFFNHGHQSHPKVPICFPCGRVGFLL